MSDPIKKYYITKYLIDGEPNFNSQIKTFIKKGTYDGDWIYKDLNTWYEIEEIFVKSWKEAGGEFENFTDKRGWNPKGNQDVDDKWHKLVGLGINQRRFHCFYGDINQAISNLGGKFYNERIKDKEDIREGESKICSSCQQSLNDYEDWEKNKKELRDNAVRCQHTDKSWLISTCENVIFYDKNDNVLKKQGVSIEKRIFSCLEKLRKGDKATKCGKDDTIKTNGLGDIWFIDDKHGLNYENGEVSGIDCKAISKSDLCDRCQQDFGDNYQDLGKLGNLNEYYIKNDQTGKDYRICPKCYLCSYCKSRKIETISNEENEKWVADVWLCHDCSENATPRSEHKKQNNRTNSQPAQPTINTQYFSNIQNVYNYFIANNIHSITNQNGNLVIIFNTNTNTTPPSQTITDEELSETSTLMEPEQKSMWKKFKDYLKKTGKNKMDKQELEQEIKKLETASETEKPTSKTPLIVGGIIAGILLIGGLFFVLRNQRKNKKL